MARRGIGAESMPARARDMCHAEHRGELRILGEGDLPLVERAISVLGEHEDAGADTIGAVAGRAAAHGVGRVALLGLALVALALLLQRRLDVQLALVGVEEQVRRHRDGVADRNRLRDPRGKADLGLAVGTRYVLI